MVAFRPLTLKTPVVTNRSAFPSPLRSATTGCEGQLSPEKVCLNPPCPLFANTATTPLL